MGSRGPIVGERSEFPRPEPIRVLQVLASLDAGGAETTIMNWYRAIDRTKIQFDFIVNCHKTEFFYEDEVRRLGGRIFTLPRFTGRNAVCYAEQWARLLAAHPEWSIVHSHHTSPAFIYGPIVRRCRRLLIIHSHSIGEDPTVQGRLKQFARWPLRWLGDRKFACSQDAADWMFGKRSTDVVLVRNGISLSAFAFSGEKRREIRNEFGLADCFIMGHVGRFAYPKNHKKLVEVFTAVHARDPRSKLLLVGTGDLRATIEKDVEARGLRDSVVFAGVRPDVGDLMSAMDIFVFPSYREGLGVVLIEAQTNGLPCVISDRIPKEVSITNQVTTLSLDRSAEEWADSIIRVGRHRSRDGGNRSLEEIRNFGYDAASVAQKLQNFYLETGR